MHRAPSAATRSRLRPSLMLAALGIGITLFALPHGSTALAQPELAPLTFTRSQADAGASAYRSNCADCHGPNLEGAGGPALTGTAFDRWRSRPVGSLHERIATTMPLGNIGGLTGAQYLAIVAFIARANGFVAGGTALPADPVALQAMGFRQ